MYHNMHYSQFLLQTGRGGGAVREENGVHRKSNHTASAGATVSREEPGEETVSCGDTEQSQVLRGHQERLKGDVSVVDIPREDKTQKLKRQGWGRRSLGPESPVLVSPHSPAITAADR